MNALDQWCFSCSAMHSHERGNGCVVCTGCGAVTAASEDLLEFAFSAPAPVVDMRFCRWCNGMRPVGHDCPAGAVGCTLNPPDGPACGRCSGCTRTQAVSLAAAAAEFEHGSSSDLDHP